MGWPSKALLIITALGILLLVSALGVPGRYGSSASCLRSLPVECDLTSSHLSADEYESLHLYNWLGSVSGHSNRLAATAVTHMSNLSVPSHCTILDIGANVGAFSAAMLDQLPHSKVIAFEAVPWYADFADRLIRQRRHEQRFEVYGTALSNTDGTTEVLVGQGKNKGWNSIVAERKAAGAMRRVCVRTLMFDTWLSQSGRRLGEVSLVKLDAEGAEGLILQGMRRWLGETPRKPIILIEIGWGTTHPHWALVVEQLEFLFTIGYARFDYQRMNRTMDWLISTKYSVEVQH